MEVLVSSFRAALAFSRPLPGDLRCLAAAAAEEGLMLTSFHRHKLAEVEDAGGGE